LVGHVAETVSESSEGFEERTHVQIEPYGRFRVGRVLNEQDIGNRIYQKTCSTAKSSTLFDYSMETGKDTKGQAVSLARILIRRVGLISPRAHQVKGQLKDIILKQDSISGDCHFTLPNFSLSTPLYQRNPNKA
jgi:hypothetical protein